MVAMAKFHLHVARHSVGPVVAWTVCPIAFKLLLSLRMFREEALYSTRFFFFRLGQIVFNRNGTRLERAFRLMLRTFTSTTTAPTTQQEEQLNQDTFNTLLTLTLQSLTFFFFFPLFCWINKCYQLAEVAVLISYVLYILLK